MGLIGADTWLMAFRDLRRYCSIVSTARVHEVDDAGPEVVQEVSYTLDEQQVFEREGGPLQ